MDIKPVDGTGRHLVSQPIQGGAIQRATTVAIVDEAKVLVEVKLVLAHPLSQVFNLTIDGAGLGLAFAGNATIDRGDIWLSVAHAVCPPLTMRRRAPRYQSGFSTGPPFSA